MGVFVEQARSCKEAYHFHPKAAPCSTRLPTRSTPADSRVTAGYHRTRRGVFVAGMESGGPPPAGPGGAAPVAPSLAHLAVTLAADLACWPLEELKRCLPNLR